MSIIQITEATTVGHELSTRRLNALRIGYGFMGVGLAVTRWLVLI